MKIENSDAALSPFNGSRSNPVNTTYKDTIGVIPEALGVEYSFSFKATLSGKHPK